MAVPKYPRMKSLVLVGFTCLLVSALGGCAGTGQVAAPGADPAAAPSLAATGTLDTATPDHLLGPRAVLGMQFHRLDCGIEGEIERGEVDDHFAQLWLPVDGDGSRTLRPDEFAATHLPLAGRGNAELFANADVDGNGEVDFREFRAHMLAMIDALDLDGDGYVTRAEAGLPPDPYARPGNGAAAQARFATP